MGAFNAAAADWFEKPKLLNIDVSGWTDEIGLTIRIQAQDDTFVAGVRLAIADVQGILRTG